MEQLKTDQLKIDRMKINHSDVPIRLFKSDFLEFFTHIHPAVVVLIWLPFAGYMGYWGYSIRPTGSSLAFLPLGFVIGLFVWTFVEYNLHRYLFHYHPKDPRLVKAFFLFHGVHHAQPQMKTRLVMPPPVSLPLGAIFVGLFYLIVGRWLGQPHWIGPLTSGFTIGYLIYDLMHYATHHFAMRWGFLKFLKRHHMQHHYKTPNQRYGVSSPLWDVVYRTLPADK